MTDRRRIRTDCPSCGTVEPLVTTTVVVVTVSGLDLTFACPTCRRRCVSVLDEPTARMLTGAGIDVQIGAPASPAPRRKSARPA